jgi:acyl-coenzyme A synthetase/AMP-(fatty) acid ligase
MDSEDPLFILYTSGSTGKPKEWFIQLIHGSDGLYFLKMFYHVRSRMFLCTADIIDHWTFLFYMDLIGSYNCNF